MRHCHVRFSHGAAREEFRNTLNEKRETHKKEVEEQKQFMKNEQKREMENELAQQKKEIESMMAEQKKEMKVHNQLPTALASYIALARTEIKLNIE